MAKFDLAATALLDNLNKSELNFVSKFLISKKYREDELIFKKGKLRDKVIIITKGLVALETETKDEVVALFKAGDAMGEMALIDQGEHGYNLKVASEELEGLELSVYNWHTIAKEQPVVAMKIYQNIAANLKDRLSHANNKLVTLFSTGKIIGQHENIQFIAENIINSILRVIPSDKALFMTFSHLTQKVNIVEQRGYNNIKEGKYYSITKDNILSILLREPATAIFNKDNSPKGHSDLITGTNTLIVTPIRVKKKVFGFIVLADKSNKRNFSINNKILLEAIANQVAPAMEDISLEKEKAAAQEMEEVYIDPFARY